MQTLTCENIVRKMGDDFTLGPINLEIPAGTITALIGNNGAGKTTLFEAWSGDYPGEGETNILGYNIHDVKAKAAFSYVPQTFPEVLPFRLQQLRDLHAAHDDSWQEDRFQAFVREFKLPLRKRISKLSVGMQRKAVIALQISRDTSFLLLDEPFAGLDMEGQTQLEKILIRKMEEDPDCSIVFATHIADEVQRLADYIVIMKHGKTREAIEKDILAQQFKRIWLANSVTGVEEAPGIQEVSVEGTPPQILTSDAEATEEWLADRGVQIMKRESLSLHESLPLMLSDEETREV
ncbi:ABC transporter ATP-binding protein [Salicibibacter halophilus]|uniref:ABC transporter ATP-binding protein n=1 Tax=Salicibibacter halophilus TaxID=2502791 RepID=A0A514LHD2_9BACI|nr:ABC transporter ATP-binding protein [Salicibibacter halophilus]QDI91263.1 ABC transporter ATP-binding protein [Salicibibacter halophilus]